MQRLALIYIDIPALRPGTVGAYVLAFLSAALGAGLRVAIDPYVVGVQFITFFPAVIITTLISGVRAGVFCTVLSAAAANFFVLEPRLSLYIEHPGEVLAFLMFVLVSLMEVTFVAGLRFAVERYRELASIVEFSDDAIASKNLDGIITSWNKGAERLFGYSAEEAIGKPVTILIPPERQDEEREILQRIRRGDSIEHYETIRQRKDGSLIDISLTVSPIRNAEGKVVSASKIARDITERKRSAQQISVLAGEAEHRARNLLANVQAIVDLSQSDTPKGVKRAIKGRIEALANVYSLFVQSRWAGADLDRLVNEELSPYSRVGGRRTLIVGPTIALNPDVAQAMAVVLHELATNAAKYGALSAAEGHVRVQWSIAADGRLVLCWTETGGPPAQPPARQGFGTGMIGEMIRDHVRGDIRFDWRPEGLACQIILPT